MYNDHEIKVLKFLSFILAINVTINVHSAFSVFQNRFEIFFLNDCINPCNRCDIDQNTGGKSCSFQILETNAWFF